MLDAVDYGQKTGSNAIAELQKDKEEQNMLSLEIIGALGLLYMFFMVGTIKAWRAKGTVRRTAKTTERPLVRRIAPEPLNRAI